MFAVVDQKLDDEITHLTVKVEEKFSANDVLNFFIPQVQVNEFMEVIPSMNDIFIQNVKN
jgi:ABC-2 type transport system ATP-binding protein